MRILVKADYILTMDDQGNVYEDAYVLVEDGRIVELGKLEELEADYDYVLDDRPCILMPGFINTHTHIAMVAYRGLADDKELMDWLQNYIWPAEAKTVDEELINLAVPIALAEMVSTGTTTFNDMYFFQNETAKIVKQFGMRAFLGEGVIDFPTPSFKSAEEGFAISKDFIEQWKDDELVKPTLCLHAPYTCSKETILKGFEIATKYDIPLHMHVAETRAEVSQIQQRYGKTPVRYLEELGVLYERFISAHSVWLDDEEIEIFAERGVGVAHNPQSNMKLASGVAPIPKMLSLGVKVGLATDGTASNNDLDMVDEMRSTALIHKVHNLDPTVANAKEVVYMATRGGAKVLGIDDTVGSIEVGKRADLITISLSSTNMLPMYDPYSHVVYSAKGSDVMSVMVDGRILMERRELKTYDPEKLLYNAKVLKDKVLKALS